MEILEKAKYAEYEEFVKNHPCGTFTQSIKWTGVKNNWGHEIVVSRDKDGKIVGGCLVLIRKIPVIGTSFLYSPRGPICDLHDEAVLSDLKKGIDVLAKKYRARLYKMDPNVLMSDETFKSIAQKLGFKQFYGPEGFETIQARFNYRLYLNGRTEDEIFKALTQKTRYNIRVALKHNVQMRVVGEEHLDDFIRLMQTTGERDGFNTRPKEYFRRMLNELGENVRMYMGFYEDKPVCAAITTNYAGETCYVYGASDNAHRNVMPNYLMQWEMIKWAIETDCRVYDFQGVSGIIEEGGHMYGLYRFKKGFNGTLDELSGEFDYCYRPAAKKAVDFAERAVAALRDIKRKLRK